MRNHGLIACLLGALFTVSCESSTSQPPRGKGQPLARANAPLALQLTGQPALAQMGTPGYGDSGMGMGTLDDPGPDLGTGPGPGGSTGTELGAGGGTGSGVDLDAGLGGAGTTSRLDSGVMTGVDAGMTLGFDAGGMTMR